MKLIQNGSVRTGKGKKCDDMRLTNDEKAILLGLLEDMAQEEDIEQEPIDIKRTIVSVIRKLGGTYYGNLKEFAEGMSGPNK